MAGYEATVPATDSTSMGYDETVVAAGLDAGGHDATVLATGSTAVATMLTVACNETPASLAQPAEQYSRSSIDRYKQPKGESP